MVKEKTAFTSKAAASKDSPQMAMAFGKINYMLMGAGVVLIFIGFYLMSGGGSSNPQVFNPEIFGTQRLTVAPIVVLLGYGVEIAAIVIKAKD